MVVALGVNSGGMDQSASIFSIPNSALYITFFPALTAELVTLPTTIPGTQEEEAVFVVANSLVVSDKVVGKLHQFSLGHGPSPDPNSFLTQVPRRGTTSELSRLSSRLASLPSTSLFPTRSSHPALSLIDLPFAKSSARSFTSDTLNLRNLLVRNA